MPSASAIRLLSHATPSHRITPPMPSSPGLTPARALVSTAQRLLRLPLRLWLDRLFPFRSQFLRPRLKHRPHHVGRHQKRKTPMLDVTPAARRPLSIASASGPRWKFRGMLLDIVSLWYVFVISFRSRQPTVHSLHFILHLPVSLYTFTADRLVFRPRRLRARRLARHHSFSKFYRVRTFL